MELIEQPLPADDQEGMAKVCRHSPLLLIADESCLREEDVLPCSRYFHGINTKLTKCGGITPALRMIQQARKLEVKVMMGCMRESSMGISAIVHLAPVVDYLDMDSILLISNNPARGVELRRGKIVYPSGNGIGVELLGRST